MGYRPTHFRIQELVPPELYELLSEEALWDLFEEEALKALDWMKDMFPKGTITINDWSWGGNYKYSGFRTKSSSDYSEHSAHSTGKGWDMKFSEYAIEEARERLGEVEYSPFVRRVELGTDTWLHVDTIKKGSIKSIYFFWP